MMMALYWVNLLQFNQNNTPSQGYPLAPSECKPRRDMHSGPTASRIVRRDGRSRLSEPTRHILSCTPQPAVNTAAFNAGLAIAPVATANGHWHAQGGRRGVGVARAAAARARLKSAQLSSSGCRLPGPAMACE